ncbi:MAG: hypothetical protein Q4D17_07780, partial [Planctomycetia bacterium]|nr:hypothetical protein [Planctomycetia bacterium]
EESEPTLLPENSSSSSNGGFPEEDQADWENAFSMGSKDNARQFQSHFLKNALEVKRQYAMGPASKKNPHLFAQEDHDQA